MTVALIVVLQRTPLGALGLVVAVVAGSASAALFNAFDARVELVRDIAETGPPETGPPATDTFDVAELRRLWRVSRSGFLAAVTALLGVCAIDILEGLLLAIGISFVVLVCESSRPLMPRLGRIPGDRDFVSIEQAEEAKEAMGVPVLRLGGILFFATAQAFQERVREVLRNTEPPPYGLVADFQTVGHIDIDGADTLRDIVLELDDNDIDFAIAPLNGRMREFLRATGVTGAMRDEPFYISVDDAVRALGGVPPGSESDTS